MGSPYPLLKELKSEERGLYLIHLLLSCGNHVASGSLENAEIGLGQISQLASVEGDTMQRIASYFAEALSKRFIRTWPGLYKALNATRITPISEDIHIRKLFFDMFPFMKVAFVLTNQAIMEAMEGEKMVHIIDLNGAEPSQWLALMQCLYTRPEGPPHLRITAIHQQKEQLDRMAHILVEEAEKFDIPFQFNPVVGKLDNLDIDKLRVKTGEALAISSVLQLHTLLASDDEMRKVFPVTLKTSNGIHLGDLQEKDTAESPESSVSSPLTSASSVKMDCFLNTLWSLSPKLMVVTEQDSNHNGATLMERLLESLYTYAALFDCLESSVSRESEGRLKVEKMLLGEEIKNIVACEGADRKERHERLEKWVERLEMAGFWGVGLSYYGMFQARRVLQAYGGGGFRMKEDKGRAVMGWQDRPLFSVSAWKCRK